MGMRVPLDPEPVGDVTPCQGLDRNNLIHFCLSRWWFQRFEQVEPLPPLSHRVLGGCTEYFSRIRLDLSRARLRFGVHCVYTFSKR